MERLRLPISLSAKIVRTTLLVILMSGIVWTEASAADRASDRIAIVMEPQPRATVLKSLAATLSESLKDALNRYQQKPFRAEVLTAQAYELQKQCVVEHSAGDASKCQAFAYYVTIDLKDPGGALYEAAVTLYSRDLKQLGQFTEKDEKDVQNPLVQPIMNQLIVALVKNIRVMMADFYMLSAKDPNDQYKQLRRTLPNMLAEGLALSGGMVLIEPLTKDLRTTYLEAADKGSAVTTQSSAIALGKRLAANYVIMGEYGELQEGMRIDIRCVNLETGEIVDVRGTTVSPISWSGIEKEMAILSAAMRSAIVSDYRVRAKRPRSLALTGTPPAPNTKENRATLLEIIRTASRKLQRVEVSDVRQREDLDAVSRFIAKKSDDWLMSEELEADMLLTFHLDRTKRDRLDLSVERFDTQSPQETDRLAVTASPQDVGEKLDELIGQIQASKWVQISGDLARTSEVPYLGLYKPYVFTFHAGPSIRTDPKLFLDAAGGLLLEFGLAMNPSRSLQFRYDLLKVRFDFLGSRAGGDKTVIGSDVLVGVSYRFRPHYETSYTLGVSAGFLGVIRDAPGENSIDGAPGAGLSASIVKTLTSARKIMYRLEYTKAFERIPERTVSQQTFDGGRPGGLYFTVGTEF